MPIYILLSDIQAFISTVICEGDRSFNLPSTPSWLNFSHPLSSFHHHPSPSPPPFAPNNTKQHGYKPLPASEGCGLNQHRLSSLRSEVAAPAAPPLSKGMWAGSDSLDRAAREGDKKVGAELFVPLQFDLFRFDEGHLSNRK